MTSTIQRNRKSEKITYHQVEALKKWVAAQGTKTDALEILGISWPTLDKVLSKGQGSPETITKIRKAISK